MKISPIPSSYMNFTSSIDEDNVIAYDDVISQNNRKLIRDHHNKVIVDYSIYDTSGRLSEYELDKLIGSLVGKNVNSRNLHTLLKTKTNEEKTIKVDDVINEQPQAKKYDYKYIMSTIKDLYNLKPIDGMVSSYRGSAANLDHWALETLADAGIKNVVALADTMVDEEDCKQYGIKLVRFSQDTNIFDHEAFLKRPNPMLELQNIPYAQLGMSKEQVEALFSKNIMAWENKKNKFMKEFINFIQTMQKGNVYIGCEFGSYKTDDALMLNHFFNPKAIDTPDCISGLNRNGLLDFENLYYNLTPEDKKNLNWSKAFDKECIANIKKLIKKYGI